MKTLYFLIMVSLFVPSISLSIEFHSPSQHKPDVDCEEYRADKTAINTIEQAIVWQWNQGKKLAGTIFVGEGMPIRALESLVVNNNPKDAELIMERGVRDRKVGYTIYITCLGADAFWKLVVSATDRTCDLNEAKNNIIWQKANNPDSIKRAFVAWPAHKVKAMYYLLLGQQHNAGVTNLYRACFSTKPYELFNLLK